MKFVKIFILFSLAFFIFVGSKNVAHAEPATKVLFNGIAVPVYFNDGDSFRVLSGPLKGTKARLAGFNTLESHGAVHQWGTWSAKELYVLAKMATLFARRGIWKCDSQGEKDTYGRILVWCPKLAEEQIRNGFAHALTVTDEPSPPALLNAQKEAIKNRRGIWAHGVPFWVLTSLHSSEEDIRGRGVYNRLVSSADGHSILWKHWDRYTECQRVCLKSFELNSDAVPEIAAKLRKSEVKDLVAALSDVDLAQVVSDYGKWHLIGRPIPKKQRSRLAKALSAFEKLLSQGNRKEVSCMVHVPFKRRYGGDRATCLK